MAACPLSHATDHPGAQATPDAESVLRVQGVRSPGPLAHQVRNACREAGFDELTLHGLRQLFDGYAARRGMPIPDLAKILGHASIQMTMRYARHAPGDVAQRAANLLDRDA